MDLSDLVRLLAAHRWQYATTMPRWPHVYTVRDWWPDDRDFAGACEVIARKGVAIPWPPPPARPIYHNRYFVTDGLKFWAMGPLGDKDLPSGCTVINCAEATAAERELYSGRDSVHQTGAWSDLSARLVSSIQSGSTNGSCTTS